MIRTVEIQNVTFRAFGWVQDPSNFRSLIDVVSVFDFNSQIHQNLKNYTLGYLVSLEDGRNSLIESLNNRPLRIKYSHLTGTAFYPRNSARCNGIIQATIRGQRREFIGDWPADNFVRWAHALGFIKYIYENDSFEITESGKELVENRSYQDELTSIEIDLLTKAILTYPPATRVLDILAESSNIPLTKFEIGQKLGFIGEAGFTSFPQNLLIEELFNNRNDRNAYNTIKSDWEGSSDKYARMISVWLCKLGLAQQTTKSLSININGTTITESIGQSYKITARGFRLLSNSRGNGGHPRITKNLYYEIFSTNASDREYIRIRRSLILKFLIERNIFVNIHQLNTYLSSKQIITNNETIIDDIKGLINIGIIIEVRDELYKFSDKVSDFVIPTLSVFQPSEITQIKDNVRARLTMLPHDYLSLIDLAFDSNQNRLFEMKTLDLLITECGYSGLHLGGSRKPDGVIYTNFLESNYGVIIDTKAYSNGYNLPISQADEMERYIRENQTRDILVNSNQWWLNFNANINEFFFMFVSGKFVGGYESQISRISRNTNVNGTAISIENLLYLADDILIGNIDLINAKDRIFEN